LTHRDGLVEICRGKREKQNEQVEPPAGGGVNGGSP